VREAALRVLRNPARSLLVGVIRLYQVTLSPGLPGRCKYYPSCSQYALDALREYGALRGSVLAAWRILRCNPLSYGGYDPVSRQKVFGRRPGSSSTLGSRSCDHGPGRCPVGLE
jgi:uncharacterized protein